MLKEQIFKYIVGIICVWGVFWKIFVDRWFKYFEKFGKINKNFKKKRHMNMEQLDCMLEEQIEIKEIKDLNAEFINLIEEDWTVTLLNSKLDLNKTLNEENIKNLNTFTKNLKDHSDKVINDVVSKIDDINYNIINENLSNLDDFLLELDNNILLCALVKIIELKK